MRGERKKEREKKERKREERKKERRERKSVITMVSTYMPGPI